MRVVIDSLVDGAWLTQSPTMKGQKVRQTTYFDDGTFGVVEYVNEQTDESSSKITKLAFKLRMTQAERNTIRVLAKTDANAEDFVDLQNSATYIDLKRKDTIQGVNALFSPERAIEILTAPILEHERYEG